jgi:predicted AAA+ superfamily ATPase
MISTEILASRNPWWRGRERLDEDEDYRKWKEKKNRWVPDFVESFRFEPFSLHFLFGPRQVGKTTALKLLIKKLLDLGVREEAIFYFSCDGLTDFREVGEVLQGYLKMREGLGIGSSYIFLDEITFPKEWYRSIKMLIDSGRLREDVLVLTGSMSLLARREVEMFPGRRGKGKDFMLLPLSFRGFLKVVDRELYERLPSPLQTLEEEEIKGKTVVCLPFLDRLNSMLEKYLACGGFPPAVESFLESGKVSGEVYDIYLSWLMTDIAKMGRSVEVAREIVKVLLSKVPSPLSWEGIAKETGVKSPKTASAYVHLLNSLFVTLTLYHIDPSTGLVNFGKNKKIHFLDPLFFHMFSRWCLMKEVEEEKMMESVVASHLARSCSDGKELRSFYWRNAREIDVVVEKDGLKGFEVKWGKVEVDKRVVGKIKQVVYLSRDVFQEKPLVVPASAFLACLSPKF